MSAATLSRVERDKQTIDVALFLTLARIFNTAPAELLGDGDANDSALASRIGAMQSRERTDLWKQLTVERREQRTRRKNDARNLAQDVEELLAQADFLRDELEAIRARLVKKR